MAAAEWLTSDAVTDALARIKQENEIEEAAEETAEEARQRMTPEERAADLEWEAKNSPAE